MVATKVMTSVINISKYVTRVVCAPQSVLLLEASLTSTLEPLPRNIEMRISICYDTFKYTRKYATYVLHALSACNACVVCWCITHNSYSTHFTHVIQVYNLHMNYMCITTHVIQVHILHMYYICRHTYVIHV